MKKVKYLILVAIIGLFAFCKQNGNEAQTVDIKAEEVAINKVVGGLASAMKAQDVALLTSYFSEDLICYGSDPSELMNKQQITELWEQMLAEVSPEINFISDRVVKIANDGRSAIAVDQYKMPLISNHIPVRNVYHLTKTSDKWEIVFFSTALIPTNEDLVKLNAALAE